ncbi:MAG: FecR domain-containing protein, partial [Myxococcales bacterium]
MNQFELHNEQHARDLGACLRDAAHVDASTEHLALEGERLRRALAQVSRASVPDLRSRPYAPWMVLAAAATMVLVVGSAVWLSRGRQTSPLTLDVIGPCRVSESNIACPPAVTTLLKFSDGSTVVAHGGARLRVPEIHTDGATLMLDTGRATVNVKHQRASTRWTVVAGPFAIAVVGTKFDVEWVPASERLSIDMVEGLVEVGGPKFSSPATVRGGQRFETNSNEARWAVTPLLEPAQLPNESPVPSGAAQSSAPRRNDAPSASDAPLGAVRARSEGAVGRGAASSVRPTAVATPSEPVAPPPVKQPAASSVSWPKFVARGDSQRVLAEAEAMGQAVCFAQCSGADLRALADAARYSGRLDMAEASLRALRGRFPSQAPVAAYLLGAVDEARGRNASALRWYEAYIAEAPRGGFFSEALAGRLRMLIAT